MHAIMRSFGKDLYAYMASTSVNTSDISMFLYVGLAAPLFEELVFRGLLMRSIEPYGQRLAIVLSALLFGLYHGNPVQTPYAFLVGLVLGYVAMEYSMLWSIVLHILNNMVLGDLLPMALKSFSEQTQNIIYLVINGLFLLIGVIVVIKNRKELVAWIRANAWEKPRMKWILVNVTTILFIAVHLAMALLTLTAI